MSYAVKLTGQKYVTALYACDGASPYGIARTLDDGQTWESLVYPGTANACLRLRFTDPMTGLAACGAGGLWRTADGALTWTQAINATVYSVDMADSSIGWACGVLSGASTIWKTTDGGVTWAATTVASIGSTALYEVRALTQLVAWVSGATYSNNWVRRHTSDGGATWAAPSATAYNINNGLNCIAAGPVSGSNIGHYVITGKADESDVLIAFSTNHGVSFANTAGIPMPGARRIVYTSSAMFLLVRQGAGLLAWATSDGGGHCGTVAGVYGNEMTQEPGTTQYVAGAGVLYKTVNSGSTWRQSVQPFTTSGPLAQCSGYLQTAPSLILPVRQ